MTRRQFRKIGGWSLAGGAIASVVAAVYFLYLAPKAALEADTTTWRSAARQYEADSLNMGTVKKRLQAIAETTLGRTEEAVSANIRKALNDISDKFKLEKSSVATLSPQPVRNPAAVWATEFRESAQRELREAVDFRVMPVTVSGKGSLEQCVGFLATVSAQDWAHRVGSVLLRPTSKERTQFEISIGLSTLFMTDLGPSKERTELWQPARPEDSVAWRGIVDKNMFRDPPPPAPAVAQAKPVAPPPAPVADVPLYDHWRVTGVVRGKDGPELWLVNTVTSEKKRLVVGEQVMEAKFLGGNSGVARLAIGADVFEVLLNQNLGQRRAVTVEAR